MKKTKARRSRQILITPWLVLISLNGCMIPKPLPSDTISSNCDDVNARSADIQIVLLDTLRECTNELRAANSACARIDKISALNGYYAYASDKCVAKGEVAGFTDRTDYIAARKEIADLSERVRKVLKP